MPGCWRESSRERSLVDFANTVVIHRSPHDVFQFLAEFENVPKWNYAIVETRKTSQGPVGVGTTYRQVRSIPARAHEDFEITAFEPDRHLAIRGTLGPFEGTLSYILEPVGEGTRLTNAADLEGHGIMRVAAPLAARRIREAVATNLGKLKGLLEAS
jgi:uncharacterized protein YndB with AHSA1/START domain